MLCSGSADCWVAEQAPAFPLLPRNFTRGGRVSRLYVRNALQLAHHSHGVCNVIFRNNFHGLDVEICNVLWRFGRCNHLGDHGHGCSILRGRKIRNFLDRAQRHCAIPIVFGGLCSSTGSGILGSLVMMRNPCVCCLPLLRCVERRSVNAFSTGLPSASML